jgi:hypothetical protein
MKIGDKCITVNCKNQGKIVVVNGFLNKGDCFGGYSFNQPMVIIESLGSCFSITHIDGKSPEFYPQEWPFPPHLVKKLIDLPKSEVMREANACLID